MSQTNRRARRARRVATRITNRKAHLGAAASAGLALVAAFMGPALTAEAADVNITTNTNRVDLDTKTGKTVDIAAGVTVKNDQPASTAGTVQATTQAWDLTNAGVIDGRLDDPFKTNDGVKFTKGGTVTNAASGQISGFYGVFTSGSTGTVTNAGTITGFLRGVEMQAGGAVTNEKGGSIVSNNGGVNISGATGTVVNSGVIKADGFNGVSLGAGGTVENKAGATIIGGTSAVLITGKSGTVTNAGTMQGADAADTVALTAGGTVTNLAGGVITGASAISNTVSITNKNAGGTVVNNSGLIANTAGKSFATGVAVENGTVNNNAGGEISGFFNGVWLNGNSTGVLNNAGKIIATGGDAVEMRGGTVQNEGQITGSGAGILNTTRDVVITNKGAITGSGGTALLLNGTGKSDVINHGKLVGGVTMSKGDGALQIFTGSTITGPVDAREGVDTLRLSGSGKGAYDGSYKNFEVFDVDAAGGTWTFTGTQAFTKGATVTAGTLVDNGTLTADLTVKSGATLTGSGSAGNTTIQGVIAPGEGIGTFNVTGDLTIQAGSTYQVQVNNTGAGDKIAATGKASITGGALAVQAAPGKYNASTEYVIITAPGGVSGAGFATLTTDMAFLTPTVRYDPNQVVLTLKISQIDFSTVAVTDNQEAVATAVQPLGPGNTIWDAILPLTADQARTALNALAGEIYPAATGAVFEESRYIREAVNERLRADQDAPTDRWALWVQPYGSWARSEADTFLPLDYQSAGVFAGADVGLGILRGGIVGGWSRSDAEIGTPRSDASVDTWHIGLYASGRLAGFGWRLLGAYSSHDIAVTRSVAFPGFSETAGADIEAATGQFMGEVDYAVRVGGVTVAPFASLTHVDLEVDGFNETGGASALHGNRTDLDVFYGSLGVRGDWVVADEGSTSLRLRGAVAWRRAFDDVMPVVAMTFGAAPTVFDVGAAPIAKDAVNVEAGFEWRAGPATRISLFYSGQISDAADDHGLRLALRWVR